jgi:hypothetical protein
VKSQLLIVSVGLMSLLFALSVPTSNAQKAADQWLRTVTDDDFVIDVNRSSMVIGPDHVISARFRTTLLKEETVPGKPTVRYLTRVDSIHFDLKDRQYLIHESSFLDASATVVLSLTGTGDWKPRYGRTADKLFQAARQLSPFGFWKVLSYRYASGRPHANGEPPELTSLVGTTVRLDLDGVSVGKGQCWSPVFEPKTTTNEEFVKQTGSPLKALGISTDKVEAITVKCRAGDGFPSQTLILKLAGNNALMLWEGVFLKIERPGNPFLL